MHQNAKTLSLNDSAIAIAVVSRFSQTGRPRTSVRPFRSFGDSDRFRHSKMLCRRLWELSDYRKVFPTRVGEHFRPNLSEVSDRQALYVTRYLYRLLMRNQYCIITVSFSSCLFPMVHAFMLAWSCITYYMARGISTAVYDNKLTHSS